MNFDINYFVKLIIIINLVLNLSANFKPAAQSFKAKIQPIKSRPKSWLQAVPKYVSTFIFLFSIIALFDIGKIRISSHSYEILTLPFALLYILFSWLQLWSFKSLKEFYSQDIVIFRGQEIIDKGPYSLVRHPVYMFEIMQGLFLALALQNIVLLFLTLLAEAPLLILRAGFEEKILSKELPEKYSEYRKKVPF